MKLINLFVVSVFLMIGITGCGGVKNDPLEISKAVIKCFKKGDFVGVKNFFIQKDAVGLGMFDDLQEAYDKPTDRNYKTVDRANNLVEAEYTLSKQKIDDETALLEYDTKTPGFKSSIKMRLIKIDGQWYLQWIN